MATRDGGVAEERREWVYLCYEERGFVREVVEREFALVDGAWYDDVMMSILESEYRAQPWRDSR